MMTKEEREKERGKKSYAVLLNETKTRFFLVFYPEKRRHEKQR